MSKLTNTIHTEVDNDYFMDIADFRDYARSMMFPDPVGIDMSDLNISLENDCNGTSSDAYLQLTFSLKHIGFSGGYNFASLFSAEYRKDTGWFVVSGEGEVLMGAKK